VIEMKLSSLVMQVTFWNQRGKQEGFGNLPTNAGFW
jgi:hypothetical protein